MLTAGRRSRCELLPDLASTSSQTGQPDWESAKDEDNTDLHGQRPDSWQKVEDHNFSESDLFQNSFMLRQVGPGRGRIRSVTGGYGGARSWPVMAAAPVLVRFGRGEEARWGRTGSWC